MDPDEPPLDSLEDEALQRHLAELRAQVQLEEQRATQRQKEQCRQAAIEEERRLQERLRQLQQDREAEEQAHPPALPSLPLSGHVPSHEQHPQMATDIKRSASAVPGHQCLSVSEAPVQGQEAHQEEQTEQRTEDVVLFSFMGPLLSESTGAQTVFVSCLSPTTSDECIGIFFENKRRNGGGPIKKLLRLNEVNALVHFRNHLDAESVVKKGHHMLDGSWLQVSLLNLEQFCERNVAVSSFSTGVCAQTVFVSCLSPTTSDECIGIFFENKRRNGGGPIKKLLRLNEVNALVHFRNHLDAESVVKKGPHKLDGSRLQVSLLNLEQFCERNVTVSSFSTSVCESKALALESKCILPKINVLSKVQGSIKDADCSKPEFEEQGEVGMEKHTISSLKSWQVKFLKIPRVLDGFYKHYPGLEVSVDEERKTAELRAPRDIMMRAFSDVLSLVTCLREVKIPLSPALVKMYEKKDSVEWIQTTLIDRHEMVCHWELCGDHLILRSHSSNLSQMEKMFKSAFTEVKVNMRLEEMGVLKSLKWTSFEKQQTRPNCPSPVFFHSGDSIIIVDTPSNVNKTQTALRRYLDENSNKTDFCAEASSPGI